MSVSATEFLSSKEPVSTHGVLVLFGPERFFRPEILHRIPGVTGEDAESSIMRFNGEHAEIRTVMTELRTVSMFGDQRIVLIDDADDFVTANRPVLEKYVASPAKGSLLILDVKSFPKSTKLFKLVEQHGVVVECAELTGANLLKWLQRVAKDEFGVREGADQEAEVRASYAAQWGGGSLCERVLSLASAEGRPAPIRSEDCGWAVDVASGWSARAVYVWRYQVVYQVVGPEKRVRTYSDLECTPFRTNVDDSLFGRNELCWAPDGSAVVSISVVLPRY